MRNTARSLPSTETVARTTQSRYVSNNSSDYSATYTSHNTDINYTTTDTFEATLLLFNLKFDDKKPGADLLKHNAYVLELIDRISKDMETFKLDAFRCTPPHSLRRWTFDPDVDTLDKAQKVVLRYWYIDRALTAHYQKYHTHASFEYTDVNGVAYDDNMPCNREEFINRVRTGV
ncbi:hypothetical protein IW150_007431, partial [Coemansia sp. RSA 2607]